MTYSNYIKIHNNQVIPIDDIPAVSYESLLNTVLELMKNNSSRHCVNYFGYPSGTGITLICCIADDDSHQIFVTSAQVDPHKEFLSLTAHNRNFEKFEREIHENFGITYTDHPWLKPVRYSFNRFNQNELIGNYPFFKADSEEFHEVGVGPIHAGIIEPGHFRFICNGEQIMHLEIQLGYQHRGIEDLFIKKKKVFERVTLAENIAGDTVIGHTTAFVNLWESLCNFNSDPAMDFARTLASELERIAIHTGDLSAICADMGYQLGNSVYGRLRTPIVNFFQEWGGNRLAKGLIRVGKINFPFNRDLAAHLNKILDEYEKDFNEMSEKFFKLPSALSRMEKTGTVSLKDALEMGVVGMAARMCGLKRDIRLSHPYNLYTAITHEPIIKKHGDVYSRVQIRREEIIQSIEYIRNLVRKIPDFKVSNNTDLIPGANKFVLSLTEGWRGEICHAAITNAAGDLLIYKIKDPSHHNWMALARSVRNNDISDFPLCNKSFNLSYCGHDL